MVRFQPLSLAQLTCLAALTTYTCGLSFLMHASRRNVNGQYLVTTSVFLAEVLKLVVSVAMEACSLASPRLPLTTFDVGSEEKLLGSPTLEEKELEIGQRDWPARSSASGRHNTAGKRLAHVAHLVFARDCWKMALPAALYVCQNMLQLFAITTISPGTYQALTQMKILAASVLSVIVLKRSYSKQQWLSILVLVVGVMLLSNSKLERHNTQVVLAAGPLSARVSHLSYTYVREWAQKSCGIIAVLAACTYGSGGAVVMEMTVKDGKASLWVRNAQLAVFSLLPAGAAVVYAAHTLGGWDPMRNFGAWAWSTVLVRSLGGFLISYVLKKCDAIMKGEPPRRGLVSCVSADIFPSCRDCDERRHDSLARY